MQYTFKLNKDITIVMEIAIPPRPHGDPLFDEEFRKFLIKEGTDWRIYSLQLHQKEIIEHIERKLNAIYIQNK